MLSGRHLTRSSRVLLLQAPLVGVRRPPRPCPPAVRFVSSSRTDIATDLSSAEGFKGYRRPGSGRPPPSGANPVAGLTMAAVGAAAAWTAIAYWERQKEMEKKNLTPNVSSSDPSVTDYALKEAPPWFEPAVADRHPGGHLAGVKKVTLYQYRTCPFCCKVRAFLDFYGINYDIIEVNSVTRKQIKWSSNYRKVPMLVLEMEDGSHVRIGDSVLIVSALASHIADQTEDLLSLLTTSFPKVKAKDEEGKDKDEIVNRYHLMFKEITLTDADRAAIMDERRWRKWADKELVHKISPNVYRTMDEALETFRWFDEAADWKKHFQPWERILVIYVGAVAMWLISKRLKKRYHLKDDVRLSLYDDANHLCKALKKRRSRFLGGEEPNLGDLAAFGALSSFEGTEAFKDMLAETNIGPWFYNVKESVNNGCGRRRLLHT